MFTETWNTAGFRKKKDETYKELKEFEDSLVREDVKCIPTDRVNDGQAVNLVLDQRVHSVKYAAISTKITKQHQHITILLQ